jgi:hypothetical protein
VEGFMAKGKVILDQSPDDTGSLQADTRFKRGFSGNPSGRKKGSRNHVNQTLVDLYSASLEGNGAADLEKLRQTDLATYWRLAFKFVPSKVESMLTQQVSIFAQYNLTDPRDYAKAWEIARQMVYGEAPAIEQEAAEMECERRDAEFYDLSEPADRKTS